MLTVVETGPAVVVCSTCRLSPDARQDEGGRRGGALLADALREAKASDPAASGIAIQEMACLFACQRHCAIHIRAPGKIGYVLGDFAPDAVTARAILDYALRHAASAEGEVRYADWPEGVKGHFITRTPPEGYVGS
jgi:predicted metal-binding protein